jgi:hypothetical protein
VSAFAAATAYRAKGWSGTLPLPPGKKKDPPTGFTGYDGQWPTDADVAKWMTEDHNLALRLPPVVVGIDVDAYGDKPGAATLAELIARWGALPPTWTTTSREDGVSGIRLYRVPAGIESWPTEAGPGIDIIRHAHRYAVVPPSVHPESRLYRWRRPDGSLALNGDLPGLGDPAELPAAWLAGLTGYGAADGKGMPRPRTARREREQQARQWIGALPGGEPCACIGKLTVELVADARREEGGAHNLTLGSVLAVLRAGETGHRGARVALRKGLDAFVATVADERGGATVAEAEFWRMTYGGVAVILKEPDERAGAGCDCGGITIAGIAPPGAPVAAEQVAEPWPEPLAAAAYHGVLGQLVRAVQDQTEADPVALLGSLLAYIGALAGGEATMHQGSWQAARLFVVLVGDTGTGRKGTAGDAVREIIRLVDPDYYKIVVPGLGSGEGLVGHMKRLRAEGGTETRALLVENELGRLLAVMAREGSTLSPILRAGWDGTPMGRTLAREEMIVHEHHVGLLGHITLSELRAKLASLDAANGFANRFLWLLVRRPHLIPVPERIDHLVGGIWPPLARALARAREPRVMAWTPDAADAWTAFYIERALRPAFGMLAAVTGRAEAQVARLALTYALADAADAVALEHLAAARAVWTYAEQSARYIFGVSTGNRHADYLLRLVRGEGGIDWDTARRELGLRTGADMAEAVALLVELGAVTVTAEPKPGGGRPRRVLYLAEPPANGANGAKNVYPAQAPEHGVLT